MSKSVDLITIFVLELFSLFYRKALKIFVLLLKKEGDPFLSLHPVYDLSKRKSSICCSYFILLTH